MTDVTATKKNENAKLIARVLEGDTRARAQLSQLVDPEVQAQTDRFCRRFCQQNKFNSQCTLKPPEGSNNKELPLCEWANASYGWMLADLTNNKRLDTFSQKEGAPFIHYVRVIVNSMPFYERWKDWRFGRRVHVPEFIEALNVDAKKIFLALRTGDSASLIASKLALPPEQVTATAEQILLTLLEHNKLHLLDPPTTRAFSELNDEAEEFDAVSEQPSQEQWLQSEQLNKAFSQLDGVEQFVLEAMVIDQEDAESVLQALAQLDLPLSPNIPAASTNKQQLYYFKRKTLAKLHTLLHRDEHN